MRRLQLARRAYRQIERASKWWRVNRTSAPLAFDEDLADAIPRIRTYPESGEHVRRGRLGDVRRVLLERVQYHVYYRLRRDDVVEILAVWHTSRGTRPY